jgi:ribose transport system permease protein
MVILSGEIDVSVGSLLAVCAFVYGNVAMAVGGSLVPLGASFVVGAILGAVNGIMVTRARVPSIIATLGMLLMLKGAALSWSGGSPRGYLPDNFRDFGRLVWRDIPVVGVLPVAVIVLVVFVAITWWLLHATQFGKLALAIGDNARAAELSGVSVGRVRVAAFVISAVSAVTSGILIGGYSGVSVDAGNGMDLQAIAAAVVGGVQLLGGRGSVPGAVGGALSLYALFTLLNFLGLPQPVRLAVQGAILIAAAAIAWRQRRQV